MRRRLPLTLVLAGGVILALGISAGSCGLDHGVGPLPDGGVAGDGGGGRDGGGTAWCGQVAPPDAANLCCASCSQGQRGCQPNGCYGGFWCDTGACRCISPTVACSGGGAQDGGTTGGVTALACSTPATYDHSESTGKCGAWRWSVKTGGDAAASQVDLSKVQQTTIGYLTGLPAPSQITSGNGMYLPRQSPTETTVFELKDVHLSFDKLEDDSDYHLVVSDGTHSMIAEVPYPGCVSGSSPFACTITHARHDVEQKLKPQTFASHPSLTVSLVGVGFFDEVHGQTGVAPNGIELHPVLRMCFGAGCDPLKAP